MFDNTTSHKQEKQAFRGKEEEIINLAYIYGINNFTIRYANKVNFLTMTTNKEAGACIKNIVQKSKRKFIGRRRSSILGEVNGM